MEENMLAVYPDDKILTRGECNDLKTEVFGLDTNIIGCPLKEELLATEYFETKDGEGNLNSNEPYELEQAVPKADLIGLSYLKMEGAKEKIEKDRETGTPGMTYNISINIIGGNIDNRPDKGVYYLVGEKIPSNSIEGIVKPDNRWFDDIKFLTNGDISKLSNLAVGVTYSLNREDEGGSSIYTIEASGRALIPLMSGKDSVIRREFSTLTIKKWPPEWKEKEEITIEIVKTDAGLQSPAGIIIYTGPSPYYYETYLGIEGTAFEWNDRFIKMGGNLNFELRISYPSPNEPGGKMSMLTQPIGIGKLNNLAKLMDEEIILSEERPVGLVKLTLSNVSSYADEIYLWNKETDNGTRIHSGEEKTRGEWENIMNRYGLDSKNLYIIARKNGQDVYEEPIATNPMRSLSDGINTTVDCSISVKLKLDLSNMPLDNDAYAFGVSILYNNVSIVSDNSKRYTNGIYNFGEDGSKKMNYSKLIDGNLTIEIRYSKPNIVPKGSQTGYYNGKVINLSEGGISYRYDGKMRRSKDASIYLIFK